MKLDAATTAGSRAVVLVEGLSDKAALETLAVRRGRALQREGILIEAMGGATNIGHFLALFGPGGLALRLAGLCDVAEEPLFAGALERAGLGSGLSRPAMEALGFYVCAADLEDELIRAVGPAGVEAIIRGQGEIGAFRTFQRQPAQQERSRERQLRRFMGTQSGRKIRYARLLAGAVDLTRVPPGLDGVLAHL